MESLSAPEHPADPQPERRLVGRLDRAAILLSSLCVVHCIATVALAATVATAGAALANPAWHETGFALAMLIGALALGRGFRLHRDLRPLLVGAGGLALMALGLTMPHGAAEIGCTVAGVLALALAHRWNMGRHSHGHRRSAALAEATRGP
jgi:hypothetical protein